MQSIDEAREQAEAAARQALVDRVLAVVSNAGTRVVYGDPVERDGRTVIAVARCRYGVGGGSGGSSPQERGDGVGAGVLADPVGYIEMGPEGVSFRPIGGERPSAAFLLAAGVAAWLALRGMARVVRALRG